MYGHKSGERDDKRPCVVSRNGVIIAEEIDSDAQGDWHLGLLVQSGQVIPVWFGEEVTGRAMLAGEMERHVCVITYKGFFFGF